MKRPDYRVLADAARDQRDWPAAAAAYAAYLAENPTDADIHIQHGHALKESGRLHEAEGAYRTAVALKPTDSDAHLQLGHLLKRLNRQSEALEAYEAALAADPTFIPARDELIRAGARHRLPGQMTGRAASVSKLSRIADLLEQNLAAVRDWISVSTYPLAAYDAFRHAFPLQPPPPPPPAAEPLMVVIEAATAAPADLRATLTSLLDQRLQSWCGFVVGCDLLADHPVGSLAAQDGRIVLLKDEASRKLPEKTPGRVVLLSAGCILDQEALGWLHFAAERCAADVIYCDHDFVVPHWRIGSTYLDPVLQGMPDPLDLAGSPAPPALLLARRGSRERLLSMLGSGVAGEDLRRSLAIDAAQRGVAAHLPRLLASIRSDGERRLAGPVDAMATAAGTQVVSILVVIPTRDHIQLLDAALDSLRSRASGRGRLDVLVVDNRSSKPATKSLLERYSYEGLIKTLAFDEPFNWSRINNFAVNGADHDIFVFMNNDAEMLTQDWDCVLASAFAMDRIGVVGARLLYPDGTVQHAGMSLAGTGGRPVHEGLGAVADDGGPLDRWRRPRRAAAVTGAFMAVSRKTFRDVGGFNERLAVGYSDLDLCLKVRESGLGVVYEPRLELIHHESKTRGMNDQASQIAWDDDELATLFATWGDALFYDPGVNPQWTPADRRPFDGLRDLTSSQVVRHLDLSARRDPWAPAAGPLRPT